MLKILCGFAAYATGREFTANVKSRPATVKNNHRLKWNQYAWEETNVNWVYFVDMSVGTPMPSVPDPQVAQFMIDINSLSTIVLSVDMPADSCSSCAVNFPAGFFNCDNSATCV